MLTYYVRSESTHTSDYSLISSKFRLATLTVHFHGVGRTSPKSLAGRSTVHTQGSGGGYISVNWDASAEACSPFYLCALPLPDSEPPDIITLAQSHAGQVLDTDWSPHSFRHYRHEEGNVFIWKLIVMPSKMAGPPFAQAVLNSPMRYAATL